MVMRRFWISIYVLAFGLSLLPSDALACATCFGAADDPQTKGVNMAILTMLLTTYTLFTVMIGVAFFLWKRRNIPHDIDTQEPEVFQDAAADHG